MCLGWQKKQEVPSQFLVSGPVNFTFQKHIQGVFSFNSESILDCNRTLNIPFHIPLGSLHTVLPLSRISSFLVHQGEFLVLFWNTG